MVITRRSVTKGFVVLSTLLVIAPFSSLYKFLSVPVPTIKINRKKIINRSELGVGEALRFSFPTDDRPAILIHLGPGDYQYGDFREGTETKSLNNDEFVAYDGVCTHLGCPANWKESEKSLPCPCHGAAFSAIDGSVLDGPPTRPIPKIKIEVDENGDVFAKGYESGLPLYGMDNVIFEEE